MANVVNLNDYRKVDFGFTLINPAVVLGDAFALYSALSHNDKAEVLRLLKEMPDASLYHSSLAYSLKKHNIEMIEGILSLRKQIDLKIVFEDFFGLPSRLDLLEIALRCLPCNQIPPTFFTLISNESINLSLINVKSSVYEMTGEHAIFTYPEALLYLQNIEPRDWMVGRYLHLRDRDGIALIDRMLNYSSRLTAADILGLLYFVPDSSKNSKYIHMLSMTDDVYLATRLLKRVDFGSAVPSDKGLFGDVEAYWFFLLNPEIFKIAIEHLDFKNPVLYERNIHFVVEEAMRESKVGKLNTNINFLLERWASDCDKHKEKFKFMCDERSDVSLLTYLLNDVVLFDKYKKYIDFSDSYVQEQILSCGYQPLIDVCKPLFTEKVVISFQPKN